MKRRSFWMMLLLSCITCGIYGIYWWYCYVEDLNTLCEGRSNEKPSPNYIVVILLSMVTCGIYGLIWYYKQGNRTADAAQTYGINTRFNGTSMLLWLLVGSLLCGLGPWIGIYMWVELFNQMVDAYNQGYNNYGGGYGNGGYNQGYNNNQAYLNGDGYNNQGYGNQGYNNQGYNNNNGNGGTY